MPSRFDDPGEYLADARALDATGVDSLWLDGDGEDPWLALAAMAAVTGQVRLVAPLSTEEAPAIGLSRRGATLARLSRGRVVVAANDPGLVEVVRGAIRCPVIVDLGLGLPLPAPWVGLADGVLDGHDSPEACAANFRRVLAGRRQPPRDGAFELWARAPFPADRANWRRTLADYAAAGATGLIVPADPRLLDLLRNPDEDDDRSDLTLAQG